MPIVLTSESSAISRISFRSSSAGLETAKMFCCQEGLPNSKQKLVIAWTEIHKEDLLADWDLAVNG